MEHPHNDHSGINLPHSPDAEMAILALIIENPKRFAGKAWEAEIGSEFFHVEANSSLFKILMDRTRGQKPVDPSSIKEDIRRLKPPGLAISDLATILNQERHEDGWDGYIENLRDSHARRIILIATQAGEGKSGREALDLMRKAAEEATMALDSLSHVTDAKQSVHKFLSEFQDRYDNGSLPGTPTGIDVIDNHTGGMRKGELWVIGAKTSGGKSVLMIQMVAQAIMEGKKVAIFTLELSTDEVVGRMISLLGRIPISQIMKPQTVTSHFFPKIKEQAKALAATGFFVCDMADMSIDTISGHCIRLKETKGLDLVVIDYIQMVSSPRVKGQNREQEVATISRGCKQLAKRLKCPVITATQLNEQGQARESRAIENDADNLFVIAHEKDGCTLQAWKCRNGERGTIWATEMDGLHQRFKNFTETKPNQTKTNEQKP